MFLLYFFFLVEGLPWWLGWQWICLQFRSENESDNYSVVLDFVTPWIIQFMEFSRPEYWNG